MRQRRLIIPILAALLLTTAWTSGSPPDPSRQQSSDIDAGAGSMMEDATVAAVRDVLARAQTDPATLESIYLFVQCLGDAGLRTLEAFGNGVGIWENRRQFRLAEADLLALVELLEGADFGALEELYGGPPSTDLPKPDKPTADHAVEIICRIELSLDDVNKTSAQRRKGEQSAELWKLAEDLIARVEEPARTGVEATDLTDALEKLGSGELAPETLMLMFHQRSEVGAADASGGFLLRLDGATASNAVWRDGKGYTDPVILRLDPADVGALALELAGATPEDLPINLYAEKLNDVAIRVMDHKVSLQARRFAGLEPDQHAEKQRQFEVMVAVLERLSQRVLAEGG